MTIKQGQDVSIQYVFICLATQWFRQISLYDNINLITFRRNANTPKTTQDYSLSCVCFDCCLLNELQESSILKIVE